VVDRADKACKSASKVKVKVPVVVIGEPPTVRPVLPVAATIVTEPPELEESICIPPAVFVIVIFEPAVRVAATGLEPVLPIRS